MPRFIKFQILITLLLLITGSLAGAQEGLRPNDMQAGSLLLRMKEGYVTATLVNTDVQMSINGLVARVSVKQKFHNEGTEWVEGVYVFPLPDGAVDSNETRCPVFNPWFVFEILSLFGSIALPSKDTVVFSIGALSLISVTPAMPRTPNMPSRTNCTWCRFPSI